MDWELNCKFHFQLGPQEHHHQTTSHPTRAHDQPSSYSLFLKYYHGYYFLYFFRTDSKILNCLSDLIKFGSSEMGFLDFLGEGIGV